jgi:hypothetical protein
VTAVVNTLQVSDTVAFETGMTINIGEHAVMEILAIDRQAGVLFIGEVSRVSWLRRLWLRFRIWVNRLWR